MQVVLANTGNAASATLTQRKVVNLLQYSFLLFIVFIPYAMPLGVDLCRRGFRLWRGLGFRVGFLLALELRRDELVFLDKRGNLADRGGCRLGRRNFVDGVDAPCRLYEQGSYRLAKFGRRSARLFFRTFAAFVATRLHCVAGGVVRGKKRGGYLVQTERGKGGAVRLRRQRALRIGIGRIVLQLPVEGCRELQRHEVSGGHRVGREDGVAADVGGLRGRVVGDALRPRTCLACRGGAFIHPFRARRRNRRGERKPQNNCREGRCENAAYRRVEAAYSAFVRSLRGGVKLPCKPSQRVFRAVFAALFPRTRLCALRVAFGNVPSEAKLLRCMLATSRQPGEE